MVTAVAPERGGHEVGDAKREEGESDLGDGQVETLKVVLKTGLQKTLLNEMVSFELN